MKKNFKFWIAFGVMIVVCLCCLFLPFIYFKVMYKTKYQNVIDFELAKLSQKNSNLTKSLVLSVIKAESNFNENAKSSADAFGLMQITIVTAKDVAKKLNEEIEIDDLFDAQKNIKIGVNYLAYLFDILQDKQLVLIAYNAGINRLRIWQQNDEIKTENGFLICPYLETTNYVKKVLNNQKIYKKILKE